MAGGQFDPQGDRIWKPVIAPGANRDYVRTGFSNSQDALR